MVPLVLATKQRKVSLLKQQNGMTTLLCPRHWATRLPSLSSCFQYQSRDTFIAWSTAGQAESSCPCLSLKGNQEPMGTNWGDSGLLGTHGVFSLGAGHPRSSQPTLAPSSPPNQWPQQPFPGVGDCRGDPLPQPWKRLLSGHPGFGSGSCEQLLLPRLDSDNRGMSMSTSRHGYGHPNTVLASSWRTCRSLRITWKQLGNQLLRVILQYPLA